MKNKFKLENCNMKKQIKKFKDVVGASIMEVILVLGIMAVLTPVVFKFTFKDLGDVKYLSLAKQLKQLIKSLTAYTSLERNNWNDASGDIENVKAKLQGYNLDTTIDADILKKLSLKYLKETDANTGKVSATLYGVVDMSNFGLDAVGFNKTLFYVEDYIGHVVNTSDEGSGKCGDCTADCCVCAIKGNWGVNLASVISGKSGCSTSDRYAVVRIDDALLEKEYDSQIYLYRNRSDVDNVMRRDLFLGSDAVKNDIKDVKLLSVGKIIIPVLKAKKAQVRVSEIENIYFRNIKEDGVGGATLKIKSIVTPKMIFEKLTSLANFIAGKSFLLQASSTGFKPRIVVSELAELINLDVQNLAFKDLGGGSSLIDIYGFSEGEGPLNEDGNMRLSKLRVEAPNVNVSTMKSKIVNVNNNYMASSDNNIVFRNGIIKFKSLPRIDLFDIKGSANERSIFTLMSYFESGTTDMDNMDSIAYKIEKIRAMYGYQNKEQGDE